MGEKDLVVVMSLYICLCFPSPPLPLPLPLAACELFQELASYEEVQHPVMTGLVGLLQPLRDSESGHTRDTALGTGKSDKEGRKGDRDRRHTFYTYVWCTYQLQGYI